MAPRHDPPPGAIVVAMSDVDARTWGRIGGLTAWSLNDAETMVGPAHRGFRARFERMVVNAAAVRGETLSPAEIAARSDRARRAHMLTLSAKSAAARKKAPPAIETPGEAKSGVGDVSARPATT